MAQPVKQHLYGTNHPSNMPQPPPVPPDQREQQGTALDYLFDGSTSTRPVVQLREPAPTPAPPHSEARSAHIDAIRQSVGAAPPLEGPNASTTEVTCVKCLKTAMPQRQWAGTSLVTTLIATIVPIGTAITLVIAGRPQPHVDAEIHRLVMDPGLEISLTGWIVAMVASIVPAAIYAGWRIRQARWVCRSCGHENVWVADSAVGKLLESKRLAMQSEDSQPLF